MKTLLLSSLALIALALTGCGTATAWNQMSPTPTASLSGEWLTIHLGADLKGEIQGVVPAAKVEGNKVYVSGHHTHASVSREFSVTVPTNAGPIEVFWVEPDKTTVPIPVTNH